MDGFMVLALLAACMKISRCVKPPDDDDQMTMNSRVVINPSCFIRASQKRKIIRGDVMAGHDDVDPAHSGYGLKSSFCGKGAEIFSNRVSSSCDTVTVAPWASSMILPW